MVDNKLIRARRKFRLVSVILWLAFLSFLSTHLLQSLTRANKEEIVYYHYTFKTEMEKKKVFIAKKIPQLFTFISSQSISTFLFFSALLVLQSIEIQTHFKMGKVLWSNLQFKFFIYWKQNTFEMLWEFEYSTFLVTVLSLYWVTN